MVDLDIEVTGRRALLGEAVDENGSVIAGSSEAGWIVFTPPSGGIAKRISSGVPAGALAVALVAVMASRSEMPSPPSEAMSVAIEVVSPLATSLLFVTVTMASSRRSSKYSNTGLRPRRKKRPTC